MLVASTIQAQDSLSVEAELIYKMRNTQKKVDFLTKELDECNKEKGTYFRSVGTLSTNLSDKEKSLLVAQVKADEAKALVTKTRRKTIRNYVIGIAIVAVETAVLIIR